jgi:hypothetical protein
MGNVVHKTQPLQIWVDVDEGIAGAVAFLNTLPGVRTFGSCQGTIGEGGAEPYRPHVLAYFPRDTKAKIEEYFEIGDGGEGSKILYLKSEMAQCEGCERACPEDELRETDDMVELCPECWKDFASEVAV